jgi:hypothetical protein
MAGSQWWYTKIAKSRSVAASVLCPSSPSETPSTDAAIDRKTDKPLPDAFTQIRDNRDKIVAAVIQRAIDDGSYQHAKWLFDLGGIVPEGHKSPEDEPSMLRLLLDQFQNPEYQQELAAEFSANDPAVE